MIRPVAYEGSAPYIFISYAHRDADKVLPIISALQERGFRVWYDAGIEAGTEWPEYIAEHLNDCGTFVAFMSENAAASHNCRREINFAIKLRKDPLVVYLEDVKMSLGMQMQLDSLQAMFYNRHSSQETFVNELSRSRVLAPCRGVREEDLEHFSTSGADAEILLQKGNTYYTWHEYSEAVNYYSKAAEQGNVEAQYKLGKCYEEGVCLDKNEIEAAKWYRKAAEQGHAAAQCSLGDCYLYERGVSCDEREAEKWYRKAAEQGYAKGQTCLGQCYENGWGIPADEIEAVKWYRKAADREEAGAQRLLGDCYFFGHGVPVNDNEAKKWYLKAVEQYHKDAQQGVIEAQIGLGDCYYLGLGLSEDKEEAIKWYRKAAERGHVGAQFQLAECYRIDCDDQENAVKWYRKAAEQGDINAQFELEDMGIEW